MDIVIYARHSDKKQDGSTGDQIARLQKWAEVKDYTILATFKDEALSGESIVQRSGMAALGLFCRHNKVDAVCCEDLSRLSRDVADLATFYKVMSFLEIVIETISEGIVNELHIGLKGTMNALYLKELADKTLRGMKAAVLRGSVPGGKIYGYDMVHAMDESGEPIRGLKAINEEEAEVVRLIFQLHLEGNSPHTIANELNAKKIKPFRAKKWSGTTVLSARKRNAGILRNSLYNGLVTFNKVTCKKDPETGQTSTILKDRQHHVTKAVPELKILANGVFEKAQRTLLARPVRQKRQEIFPKDYFVEKPLPQEVNAIHNFNAKIVYLEKKLKQTPKHIIARKLKCVECNKSILVMSEGHYQCEGCDAEFNKKELIEQSVKALKKYTFEDFQKGVKSLEDRKKALLDKLLEKKILLVHKESEIKKLYRTFLQQTGEESAPLKKIIDELEQGRKKISLANRRLFIEIQSMFLEVLDESSPEEIFDRLQEQIEILHTRKYNVTALTKVYRTIEKIHVSKAAKTVSVAFDMSRVLFVFGRLKKRPDHQDAF